MSPQRDDEQTKKERQGYSANGPWTAEMSNSSFSPKLPPRSINHQHHHNHYCTVYHHAKQLKDLYQCETSSTAHIALYPRAAWSENADEDGDKSDLRNIARGTIYKMVMTVLILTKMTKMTIGITLAMLIMITKKMMVLMALTMTIIMLTKISSTLESWNYSEQCFARKGGVELSHTWTQVS